MAKAKHQRAVVHPFSSIVGSGVVFHNVETGAAEFQIAMVGVGGDTNAEWKERSIAAAEYVALRVNAHDDLVHALTMVRDHDEDQKNDGEPHMPAIARRCIDRALEGAIQK